MTVEAHTAGCWLDEPQSKPTQGALARTGFAHKPQSFPGLNIEAYIIHGADFGLPGGEGGFALRENLGQIADLNKRHEWMLTASLRAEGRVS